MANDVTDIDVNTTASDCCSSEDYNAIERFLLSNPHIALWKFIPPVIMVLGTFGNVMTIVIMRRMSEGQSSNSMSLYFTALALSDLVILYAGLPQLWVNYYFDVNVLTLNIFLCKLIPFLVDSSCIISAWLIVSMTMQRVMSIVWPHHKSLSCTKRKVELVIATIAAIPIALNAQSFISHELVIRSNSTDKLCSILNKELKHFALFVYPWIDLALSSITPFCILFIGNSVLVWKVIQSVQVARVMTAGGCDQVNSRQKKASSLTLTLITVTLTFLLLSLPSCIYYIVLPYIKISNNITMATVLLVGTVCLLAWYSSSAINFYLYCLTGSRFRNELKSLFCERPPALKASKVTFLTSETTSLSIHSESNHASSDF